MKPSWLTRTSGTPDPAHAKAETQTSDATAPAAAAARTADTNHGERIEMGIYQLDHLTLNAEEINLSAW
jgi:hypothetical protein